MRVGLVGCGNISRQYLDSLERLPGLALTVVADLDPAAAAAVAERTGAVVFLPDALLTDDEVDVVLNLTTPQAHAPLTIAALEAGKHVYLEKPFATSLADADAMLAAAARADRRIGSAPDTVLGTGTQTARALIDRGEIGQPVAATAFMLIPGHEAWHPSPGFYYATGGGPLLDMGPYYLTSLVTMLGPVETVTAKLVSVMETPDAAAHAAFAGLLRSADGAAAMLDRVEQAVRIHRIRRGLHAR